MKNIYGILGLLLVGFNNLSAQQLQNDSDLKNSSIDYKVNDDIQIKVGGRVAFDGALYSNDKTDMSSGIQLGEARLNMGASFGSKFDLKFSVDFAGRSPENTERDVDFKDIYLRWNINENSSLRIGNFAQPFSAGRIISAGDNSFIARSGTTNALTESRRFGISYKTICPKTNIWAEASVFGGDLYKRKTGDDAWGLSGRAVYNPKINDDLRIHIGLGLATRTPDANNFTDGDDDYNRHFNYSSNVETLIDKTKVINADIQWAKQEIKYNTELIVLYKNFMLQGEYTGVNISRERNNQREFEKQLGGMWSYTNLEAWEKFYGKDIRNLSFKGYYIGVGWIIKGGNYQYNNFDALAMVKKEKGTLELVARYNRTNLNDIDGIWYNGTFYDPNKGPGIDAPNFNHSIAGGILNSYTIGLNYYINKNIRLLTNYGYSNIDNLNLDDKYTSVFQTRLQINF